MNIITEGEQRNRYSKKKSSSKCTKVLGLIFLVLLLGNSIAITLQYLDVYDYIDIFPSKNSTTIISANDNKNNEINLLDYKTMENVNKNHKTTINVKEVPLSIRRRAWRHILDIGNSYEDGVYDIEKTNIGKSENHFRTFEKPG